MEFLATHRPNPTQLASWFSRPGKYVRRSAIEETVRSARTEHIVNPSTLVAGFERNLDSLPCTCVQSFW